MTEFKLDTSGGVLAKWDGGNPRHISWTMLSPFVQGYVEAQAEELAKWFMAECGLNSLILRFVNWAPETLARIIEDCEALDTRTDGPRSAQQGRDFWTTRQTGDATWSCRFPPLTVYLSDDGKVCLREGA